MAQGWNDGVYYDAMFSEWKWIYTNYFWAPSQNCEKPRHVCPSVCPHGTTRLPLEGFSWNLIFKHFSEMCRENSDFFTIWQEYGNLHEYLCTFMIYLSHIFLEWEIFRTNAVAKIKTHILRFSDVFANITPFVRSSSSCAWRVRRVSCSSILKMKLVPPSLPRSSYVPSSFRFIL